MNKSIKMLFLPVVSALILLIATGCANNSSTGKYYREFGDYTSTTMYIELKNDMTFETDGSSANLRSEGTYEINGSEITFTSKAFFSDEEKTLTGTISGDTIKIDGVTYRK